MSPQTKVILLTVLSAVSGLSGYLVLRADCISFLVIRPCDDVAATIGVSRWGVAVAMAILAKRIDEKSDNDSKPRVEGTTIPTLVFIYVLSLLRKSGWF